MQRRFSRTLLVLIVLAAVAVGDAAKHTRPEDSFLEEEDVVALPTTGGSPKGNSHAEIQGPNCAVAYMNKEKGCKDARKMPCLEGAFPGRWFGLNRKVVMKATMNMTERAEQMRQGFWINGQDIRSEFVAKLPEDDLFAHLTLPVHRCALVSSSGAMLGSGLGPRIDSHHLVMRLNNAPVKGFEKDVGRRTTLRLTAAPFSGFRESPDEAVIASWCPENHKCGLKQELETLLDKKVYPLNPYFWKYANSPYFRKRGVEVSSGMVAFALLAHHCEHVSLFGFSGEDARDWYYVKREAKFKQIAQSEWLSNKAWVVDGWKLVTPRKRGSEKRARQVDAGGGGGGGGSGGGGGKREPKDEGEDVETDDEEAEEDSDAGRRRLLELLGGIGGHGLGGAWGAEGVASAGSRGARRALLGSFDVERACFQTLGAKGVVTLFNGTDDIQPVVRKPAMVAATAGAKPGVASAGAAANAVRAAVPQRKRAAAADAKPAGAAAGRKTVGKAAAGAGAGAGTGKGAGRATPAVEAGREDDESEDDEEDVDSPSPKPRPAGAGGAGAAGAGAARAGKPVKQAAGVTKASGGDTGAAAGRTGVETGGGGAGAASGIPLGKRAGELPATTRTAVDGGGGDAAAAVAERKQPLQVWDDDESSEEVGEKATTPAHHRRRG